MSKRLIWILETKDGKHSRLENNRSKSPWELVVYELPPTAY